MGELGFSGVIYVCRGFSRALVYAVALVVVLWSAGCTARSGNSGPRWELLWADEFAGPAATAPDPSKWSYDIGGGGWGNHELQEYTDSTDNVFQDGKGYLHIRASRTPGGFRSGRIKTQGKFSFTFGKLDARIKIPYATGVWPAFWLLGDSPGVRWPNAGEIDVMENFGPSGSPAFSNHGTLHGPGYASTGITARYDLPDRRSFADDFHVFSIERSPGSVEFFVDGASYQKVVAGDPRVRSNWVFDAPFFLLLNVAVGGSPAPVGAPAESTRFPQDMLIDYVRVYKDVPSTQRTRLN
jgi:beta-glucanase (GH16 family)